MKYGVIAWNAIVLGDSIIFSSFVDLILQHDQNAEIYIIIEEKFVANFLLVMKEFESKITLIKYKSKKRRDILSVLGKVRKCKLDYIFNFKASSTIWNVIFYLSGAKKKVQTRYTSSKIQFKNFLPFKKTFSSLNIYECLQKMFNDTFYTSLSSDIVKMEHVVKATLSKKTIGIAIGASNSVKALFPLQWVKVIEFINTNYSEYEVVLIGSNSVHEKKLSEMIEGEVTKQTNKQLKYTNLVGKTSLNDTLSLVKALDLIITNDSGLMHLASVFGIKTVTVFGFSNQNYFSPHKKNFANFYYTNSKLECAPCFKFYRCPHTETHNELKFTKCLTVDRTKDINNLIAKAIKPS